MIVLLDHFARGVRRHPLVAYGIVPAALTLSLIGLYFSGSPTLQAIVAPTIEALHPFSWREFGALEWLQNVLLALAIATLVTLARAVPGGPVRLIWAGMACGFAFVLLEEVDYGAHLVEFFGGELGSLSTEDWDRNLHNRTTAGGVQYGSYMRLGATVFVAIWFVLAPLLAGAVRHSAARALIPSRWTILTVALMVVLSSLAHRLDDAGFAVIGGVPGNLEKNISEFRELVLYYLFTVYFLDLLGRLPGGAAPGVRASD